MMGHRQGTGQLDRADLHSRLRGVEAACPKRKIHHGFERMRIRGVSGARDEFHLAAIAQNLKTLPLQTLKPPDQLQSASFDSAQRPNRSIKANKPQPIPLSQIAPMGCSIPENPNFSTASVRTDRFAIAAPCPLISLIVIRPAAR